MRFGEDAMDTEMFGSEDAMDTEMVGSSGSVRAGRTRRLPEADTELRSKRQSHRGPCAGGGQTVPHTAADQRSERDPPSDGGGLPASRFALCELRSDN